MMASVPLHTGVDGPVLRPAVWADWLAVESDLDPGVADESRDLEMLLVWNATLRAGAKFVLGTRSLLSVRAEYPSRAGSPRAKELNPHSELNLGVSQACELWGQSDSSAEVQPAPSSADLSDESKNAVAESGWEASGRDGAQVANLEIPERFVQAQIVSVPSGGLFAYVEIVSMAELSKTARQATADLLLRAGAGIRWVRPAIRSVGEKTAAVFEVAMEANPADIADGLSVLSIAGRMTMDEAEALADEGFASDYLQTVNPSIDLTLRKQATQNKGE